ncbi:MAG: TrkA C-terminal domain-containing protein [Sporomusaceae bacterium]|nr:TrkA C-terminal domain-containing protein [Sporomusaceae bacterium]
MKRSNEATYKVIALDIAKKIMTGEYPIGTKISGRSILSSQYNVSPETIRRAIILLKTEKIVDVSRGKEIIVTSSDNCSSFIEQHHTQTSTVSLYQKLDTTFKKKQLVDQELKDTLDQIASYLKYMKYSDLLNPVEVTIPFRSPIIGKTIQDLNFWKHTQGTIVAVVQNNIATTSPDPDLILHAGDSIVAIGPGNLKEVISAFISPPPKSKQTYLKKAFSVLSTALLVTEETALLGIDFGEFGSLSCRLISGFIS